MKRKPSAKAKRKVGKRGDGIQTASRLHAKRSRAAKRGWETRRRNERREFRRRSEAAKRGWATKKLEHERRSQAAKRGWETRRRKLEQGREALREAIEAEVITRRAYKPGRTSHTKREQRVEVVSRGPLRSDLSNVIRVTVGTRVYTRRQDIETLSYLIHGALDEGTPF